MNKRIPIIYGGLVATIATLGWGIDKLNYNSEIDIKKLYSEVLQKADKNNDGNVTESEWLRVYKFLEKPYDSRQPSSLNVKEMRKYLSIE